MPATHGQRILVAGLGPGGLAAALRLAAADFEVIVCDPRAAARPRSLEVLSSEAVARLHRLDVALPPGSVRRDQARIRWHGDRWFYRDYWAEPGGGGYIVDRRALDAAMADRAARSGIRFRAGCRVMGVREDRTGVVARLSTGGGTETLAADGIVDASGRAAVVARRLGAMRCRRRRLLATAFRGTARRRQMSIAAADDGWWSMLALADQTAEATYFHDPDTAGPGHRTRPSADDAAMLDFTPSAGKPQVRDAAPALTEPMAGRRWVAVGDAAAACDPLAGMGLEHALTTGVFAASALAASLDGNRGALTHYADAVRAAFQNVEAGCAAHYAAAAPEARHAFWRHRAPVRPDAEAVHDRAVA